MSCHTSGGLHIFSQEIFVISVWLNIHESIFWRILGARFHKALRVISKSRLGLYRSSGLGCCSGFGSGSGLGLGCSPAWALSSILEQCIFCMVFPTSRSLETRQRFRKSCFRIHLIKDDWDADIAISELYFDITIKIDRHLKFYNSSANNYVLFMNKFSTTFAVFPREKHFMKWTVNSETHVMFTVWCTKHLQCTVVRWVTDCRSHLDTRNYARDRVSSNPLVSNNFDILWI